jgi:hypothetical protein
MQCGHDAGGHRITRASLALGPIVMTAIAFDFDPPGHRADAEWSADVARKLEAMIAASGGFGYSTRVGWRYVVQLAAPHEVVGAEGWKAWRERYAAACDALDRDHGLAADRSCSTPGSLFRLPRAVRDGLRLEPLTIGDPERLGAFELPAAPMPSSLLQPHPPRVVASRPAAAKTTQVGVVCEDTRSDPGRFLVYRKLEAAGAVGDRDPASPHIYRIRCPRAQHHGNGADGTDGSTVLFLPAPGPSGYGRIHCHHAACAGEDLTAIVLEGPVTRREVQIVGVGAEADDYGAQVTMKIQPADGAGELPVRYVRIHSSPEARWAALWEAANVSDPTDLDPEGDLGGAIGELRGRTIAIELDADARVRRLLAPEVAA